MSNNNDNVVSTTDVAPVKEPKSFNDLKKDELVLVAQAFGSDDTGSAANIKADLLESGVTWQMYLEKFRPEAAATVEEEEVLPEPVDEGVNEEVTEVATAEAHPVLTQQKYLIKMVRANPYFEFEDKKFTKDKPYAIMDAAQAQRILETEEGFRQAYPAELAEFYA